MATTRKYDLVVFGATGFTGQYTVDEVARVANEEKLTWAIAGRTMSKLQIVLSESSKRIDRNIEDTPIIIADTSSYQSLVEMAEQCKVVLNCVGPYRFYGEEVIKACIEAGADHLDISGEPQFLEKMQLLYNGKAKEKEVFIIGSTGFDSIPSEMGISYTRKQFKGGMTNIESFLDIQSGPKGLTLNTGTMESAMHVAANMGELKSLRQSLFQEPLPKLDYELPKRFPVFYDKNLNKWCVSFMGDDSSAVNRSMRDLLATGRLEKPFGFMQYFAMKSFFNVIALMVLAIIFGIMSQFSLGKSLLLKFPHIFTFGVFKKGGPSKSQIEGTAFSLTFIGHGYKESVQDRGDFTPDKVITTRVIGPELAYVATPICMVQCAITLLKEKDKLYHKGGVLSPGAVFVDTTLVDRLQTQKIKFSVIE